MEKVINKNDMTFSNSQFVRDPTKVIHSPIWDKIANDLGEGSLVVGDGDMYVCNYKNNDLFFGFEIKKQGVYMKARGQFSIHNVIDHALRNDPTCNYAGFYILWYLGERRGVRINYKTMLSFEDFYKFLAGTIKVEPFDLEDSMKKSGWL